jgi:dihydrofolate reductase
MRRLRYQVAVTLDGFIAGPQGEYDWIVTDPAIDFAALYREFDTAIVGRKTYEVMTAAQEGSGAIPGMDVIVFSKTLAPAASPGVRIVNSDPVKEVAALKRQRGRDLWLFGGGQLFRSLLDAALVDTVELAVMPVLIGQGIPLLPPGSRARLTLAHQRTLPKSGIVFLSYAVEGTTASVPPPRFLKTASARTAKEANARKNRKKSAARSTSSRGRASRRAATRTSRKRVK